MSWMGEDRKAFIRNGGAVINVIFGEDNIVGEDYIIHGGVR